MRAPQTVAEMVAESVARGPKVGEKVGRRVAQPYSGDIAVALANATSASLVTTKQKKEENG